MEMQVKKISARLKKFKYFIKYNDFKKEKAKARTKIKTLIEKYKERLNKRNRRLQKKQAKLLSRRRNIILNKLV